MKGRKRQKASDADRERRVGQLDDEPGERDVLHPGAADRDHLAGEEEAVVAVAAEARERARVEREQRRRHRSLPSGSIAASTAASSSVVEPAQAVREPRRPAGADASQQPLALVGERQADAAPVVRVALALESAGLLEPVDVPGERRRRDALLGGQLAQAQARGCHG